MESDYSNLEVLNKQIHELGRIIARGIALVVFFLILIICLLILQNWQLILGILLWLSSLIAVVINYISATCSQSKGCASFIEFTRSAYIVLGLTCVIVYLVYLISTLFTRGSSKKITPSDNFQLRQKNELDAEMREYWRRKREYASEAEAYLAGKGNTKISESL